MIILREEVYRNVAARVISDYHVPLQAYLPTASDAVLEYSSRMDESGGMQLGIAPTSGLSKITLYYCKTEFSGFEPARLGSKVLMPIFEFAGDSRRLDCLELKIAAPFLDLKISPGDPDLVYKLDNLWLFCSVGQLVGFRIWVDDAVIQNLEEACRR